MCQKIATVLWGNDLVPEEGSQRLRPMVHDGSKSREASRTPAIPILQASGGAQRRRAGKTLTTRVKVVYSKQPQNQNKKTDMIDSSKGYAR